MDQLEPSQQFDEQPAPVAGDAEAAPGPATATAAAGAATPGPAPPAYVYAIGRVEPRFPSLAVEKEFAQVLGRGDTAGVTDREALQQTLADRANRYLARRVCWVFLVENLETYVLVPRDPADLELLIDAVRAESGTVDVDVIVGQRGPITPPELCGGLSIPLVVFDQIWSFPRNALLSAIPRPEAMKDKKRFEAMAGELFDRVMQLADNAGATDQHRALNYLAVRYPAIYARTAEAYAENASLSAVEVRPSRLAGIRNIVDVVFAYTHRETDVTERYFVRVDVTEEFPFLVSRLAPFYDR
jgi:hypothetical protein